MPHPLEVIKGIEVGQLAALVVKVGGKENMERIIADELIVVLREIDLQPELTRRNIGGKEVFAGPAFLTASCSAKRLRELFAKNHLRSMTKAELLEYFKGGDFSGIDGWAVIVETNWLVLFPFKSFPENSFTMPIEYAKLDRIPIFVIKEG